MNKIASGNCLLDSEIEIRVFAMHCEQTKLRRLHQDRFHLVHWPNKKLLPSRQTRWQLV